MKKIAMVFALLTSSILVSAQNISESVVPPLVKSAFSQKFSDATTVKWEKENANEYEAEFRIAGIGMSANFSADGKWLETETEISFAELPQAVTNSFLKNHKHSSKVEVAKIEMASGKIVYEIEMKGETKGSSGSKEDKGSKGSSEGELFYDENGKELKGSK